MPSVAPDPLSSLLAEVVAAGFYLIVMGVESALAEASLPPPSSDALVLALARGLEQWELNPKQIVELRQRIEAADALTPQAKTLIEAGLAAARRQPEPEANAEE